MSNGCLGLGLGLFKERGRGKLNCAFGLGGQVIWAQAMCSLEVKEGARGRRNKPKPEAAPHREGGPAD